MYISYDVTIPQTLRLALMDQEVEMGTEAKAKAKEVISSAKQAVERLLKEAKTLAGKLTCKTDDLYFSLTLCILSYCFVRPC